MSNNDFEKDMDMQESFDAEIFWNNKYEKALEDLEEKNSQIATLKKENDELRNEYEFYYHKAAESEILFFVVMLTLPLMALGCTYLGKAISAGGLSLGLVGLYLLMTVICIFLSLFFLYPLLHVLVNEEGFALAWAYKKGQHWKLFLAACGFLVFAILLITIKSKYE